MAAWLDDLAVSVATEGISRRRALRIAAGAALAALLPSPFTRAARADAPSTCAGSTTPWSPGCKSPVQRPGYVNSYNGCGPADGLLKYVLPDFPMGANFESGCNQHDLCYGTCGSDKDICDTQFHNSMLHACDRQFGGGGLGSGLAHGMCTTLADDYWAAVVLGGQGAWTSAQQDACECCACPNGCGPCEYCDTSSNPDGTCLPYCTAGQTCCGGVCRDPCPDGSQPDPISCTCPSPQFVYCACNSTCYTDPNVCLSNCHATLGCFSGICGPAQPGQCS